MIMDRQKKGAFYESLARGYLDSLGYRFVAANFVRRVGEIDLIMQAPDEEKTPGPIVFIEVRYRSTSEFGGAVASIDWRKQRKMARVALAWLQQHADSTQTARIDVIAIRPSTAKSSFAAEEIIWKGHQLTWLQNAVENAT